MWSKPFSDSTFNFASTTINKCPSTEIICTQDLSSILEEQKVTQCHIWAAGGYDTVLMLLSMSN
jgi:hypothetical protein